MTPELTKKLDILKLRCRQGNKYAIHCGEHKNTLMDFFQELEEMTESVKRQINIEEHYEN